MLRLLPSSSSRPSSASPSDTARAQPVADAAAAGPHRGASGRGDSRVRPRQRTAGAAGARRFEADDDGEPHLPGRLAPRELRRDRHGASARAPAVQGLAEDPRRLGRIQPARLARQRHDLVRPHQLLRQLRRRRRQPALVSRLAGRRDGQQQHRAHGPRHRDDGGAQRDGARREQPGPHPAAARRWRPCTTGTTTARARSARAAMSRTSTSRACRRSIAASTSPTTRPSSSPAASTGRETLGWIAAVVRARCHGRRRSLPATLHARSGPGRRAHGHRSPRRRRAARHGRVPRAARVASGHGGGRAARPGARRRAGRPPSQAAGREAAWRRARRPATDPLAEPAPLLLRAELAPGQDVERARAAMLAAAESLRHRAGHGRGAGARERPAG